MDTVKINNEFRTLLKRAEIDEEWEWRELLLELISRELNFEKIKLIRKSGR